jgi:hypothetical protein
MQNKYCAMLSGLSFFKQYHDEACPSVIVHERHEKHEMQHAYFSALSYFSLTLLVILQGFLLRILEIKYAN